jgi:hypothetical protein
LLEASLWEIKGGPAAGSIQNILTHIMGLRKIIETYLKPRDSEQSLFQRTVQMLVHPSPFLDIHLTRLISCHQGDLMHPRWHCHAPRSCTRNPRGCLPASSTVDNIYVFIPQPARRMVE